MNCLFEQENYIKKNGELSAKLDDSHHSIIIAFVFFVCGRINEILGMIHHFVYAEIFISMEMDCNPIIRSPSIDMNLRSMLDVGHDELSLMIRFIVSLCLLSTMNSLNRTFEMYITVMCRRMRHRMPILMTILTMIQRRSQIELRQRLTASRCV